MLFEWVASSSTGGYCFCFVYDKYIQAFKDVVDDDDAKSALSRRLGRRHRGHPLV